MDKIKQFSDAVLNGVPKSPLPPSQFGLDNWSNPMISQAGKSIATGNLVRAAGFQADEDEKRRAQAAKEQQMRAEIENDPSKFQRLRKDDGGFAFYDPFGKEIDIDTYSKKTGQKRVDILQDSENPLDQQYIEDWNRANEVGQAMYQNDIESLKKFMADDPSVFKEGASYQNVMEGLVKKYPHIYGRGRYEESLKNSGRPLFSPRKEDEDSNVMGMLRALMSQGQ